MVTAYRKLLITLVVPEADLAGLERDLKKMLPAMELPLAYYEHAPITEDDLAEMADREDH